jgi:hypothetical protein
MSPPRRPGFTLALRKSGAARRSTLFARPSVTRAACPGVKAFAVADVDLRYLKTSKEIGGIVG